MNRHKCLMLIIALFLVFLLAACDTGSPTPALSIADQITKAFSFYTDPPVITPYSSDSFLVELHATGTQGGEAETSATAISVASMYEKTA